MERLVRRTKCREHPAVALQPVTQSNLSNLAWEAYAPGWFRIVADITCARCGNYQALDSDPVEDKEECIRLSLRLLHQVGWRVDGGRAVLCPQCAS